MGRTRDYVPYAKQSHDNRFYRWLNAPGRREDFFELVGLGVVETRMVDGVEHDRAMERRYWWDFLNQNTDLICVEYPSETGGSRAAFLPRSKFASFGMVEEGSITWGADLR
jgi:hypothetical protein